MASASTGDLQLPRVEEFTHAVVCALPKERLAVEAVLETTFDAQHAKDSDDPNVYTLGINSHSVKFVVCSLPDGEYGKVRAASTVTNMLRTYKSVRRVFFVGIGGACPDVRGRGHKLDVRLGDVVISKHAINQFDLGKLKDGKVKPTGHLKAPGVYLRGIASKLEQQQEMKRPAQLQQQRLEQHLQLILRKMTPQTAAKYARPSSQTDVLYQSDAMHVESDEQEAERDECCAGKSVMERVPRAESFRLHMGHIGCSDAVLKDARVRDALMLEHQLACVEMESASVALHDHVEYIVIRGLCDYADTHKNKRWQEYACATAAAVFKELSDLISQHEALAAAPAAAAAAGSSAQSVSPSSLVMRTVCELERWLLKDQHEPYWLIAPNLIETLRRRVTDIRIQNEEIDFEITADSVRTHIFTGAIACSIAEQAWRRYYKESIFEAVSTGKARTMYTCASPDHGWLPFPMMLAMACVAVSCCPHNSGFEMAMHHIDDTFRKTLHGVFTEPSEYLFAMIRYAYRDGPERKELLDKLPNEGPLALRKHLPAMQEERQFDIPLLLFFYPPPHSGAAVAGATGRPKREAQVHEDDDGGANKYQRL